MGANKEVLEMGSERKTGSWQTEWIEETSGHRHSTECTRRQTAHTGALSALFTAASLAPGIVTPFCAHRLARHAQYT